MIDIQPLSSSKDPSVLPEEASISLEDFQMAIELYCMRTGATPATATAAFELAFGTLFLGRSQSWLPKSTSCSAQPEA